MDRIVVLCGSTDIHQLYIDVVREMETAGDDLNEFFPELNQLMSNVDGRMIDINQEQIVDMRLVEELLQTEFETAAAMEESAAAGGEQMAADGYGYGGGGGNE